MTDRERALVEAARPFARASQIMVSHCPDGASVMRLNYPAGSNETFAIGCLKALQEAIAQYEEPKA